MWSSLKQIDFLSWKGMLPREDFWRAYPVLAIPNYIAYKAAPFATPAWFQWLVWSFFVFTALLIVFQVIKRLRSTGRSGWMSIILFFPFLNLYVLYLLFLKK